MPDRLYVRAEPGQRFGRHTISGGPSVEALADLVWVGEAVKDVADEYGLSRDGVLLACWHTARYGRRGSARRRAWKPWLEKYETDMAGGRWDAVPDPPDRDEMKEKTS